MQQQQQPDRQSRGYNPAGCGGADQGSCCNEYTYSQYSFDASLVLPAGGQKIQDLDGAQAIPFR